MIRSTRFALFCLFVLAIALITQGSIPQVATGTWSAGAKLQTARSGAASVLLPDGRILIAGGTGVDATGQPVTLASVEIIDTAGNAVSAASMSVARTGAAAIALPMGSVLVTGGKTSDGGITNSAELYDPLANAWQTLPATMVSPRSGHTMSQLLNGDVLIAGGDSSSGPVAAIETFDEVSSVFAQVGTLATGRKDHAAAVLNDGRVLIVGGTDASAATLASTEVFDINAVGTSTNPVSAGPALNAARAHHSATTLLDGTVLIVGGSAPATAPATGTVDLASAEIFDPVATSAANTTSLPVSLATAHSGHLAFLLPNNNNVLIVGGTAAGTALSSVEMYTPWTQQFATMTSMSTARAGATGAGLSSVDGLLQVLGGQNASAPALASSEYYGFATVKTDRPDYLPGDIVTISGTGWQAGETVTLTIHPVPNAYPDVVLTAKANASGNISNSGFVLQQTDYGLTYRLTAVGAASQAQNSFSDGNPNATITFPVKNTSYNAAGWNNGCGLGSAAICGTAKTAGNSGGKDNTIKRVQVSISNSGTPAHCWSGSDFTAACPYWLDATVTGSGNPNAATWSYSFPASNFTADGTYTVKALATDSTTATGMDSVDFAIDTTPPAPPSTPALATGSDSSTVGDNITKVSTPTFAGTAPANTTVKIYSDGAEVAHGNAGTSGNYSLTASTLADGTHSITATATDDAGNVSDSSGTLSITIDTVAPTVTINQAATQADPTSTSPIYFTVVFSESVTGFATGSVTLGGTAGATTATVSGSGTSYSVAVSGMTADGTVTASLAAGVAHDTAGNLSMASTSTDNTVQFNLDTTPPEITPNVSGTAGKNGWYTSDVTVSWDVVDNESAITSKTGCDPTTINADTAGTTLTCSATSAGGTASKSVTINRDAAPPTITLATRTPANSNGWNKGDVTLTWNCSDPISDVVNATVSQTVSSEGANQSSTGTCEDKAGNTASDTQTGINIDKTVPALSTCDVADGNWHADNVTLHCTYTDSGSGPASQQVGLSTNVASGVEDANASASAGGAQACDLAGNCAASPADITGNKIDRKVPQLSGCDAPDGSWHGSDVTLKCHYTDGGSGPATLDVTLTTNVANGEENNNAIAAAGGARACDAVGNCATSPDNIAGNKVDKKAPQLQSCDAPDGQWHATNVTLHCTYTDGGSGPPTQQVSLSTNVSDGTETASAAASAGGAQACDSVGNCAASPTDIAGNKVDKKAPSITITSPSNSSGYLINQVVYASYMCTDSGSGVATCSGTVPNGEAINTSSVGGKSFTVNATDKVGNTATPVTYNYSVSYAVCPLYDQGASHKSNSTVPVKLYLCDASGNDVSNSSIVVTATNLTQVSTNTSAVVDDSGTANPDNNFRFDPTLGPSGGYIFNLSTKGLSRGQWMLSFTVSGEPSGTPHSVGFFIK